MGVEGRGRKSALLDVLIEPRTLTTYCSTFHAARVVARVASACAPMARRDHRDSGCVIPLMLHPEPACDGAHTAYCALHAEPNCRPQYGAEPRLKVVSRGFTKSPSNT